jgi:GNAT superfamily N-acetyltransferase
VGWRFLPLRQCPELDLTGFDCGNESVNAFLKEHARICEAGDRARSFLMLTDNTRELVGYYCISNNVIPLRYLPAPWREGQPPFPLPVILIGQFGIDKRWQGKGLSICLLRFLYEHLYRIYQHGDGSAFAAVRVDTNPEDLAAQRFWKAQGFYEFEKSTNSFFYPIRALVQAIEQPRKAQSRLLLFYSYSHRDERLLEQLKAHLIFLEHQDLTVSWCDRKILPGEMWEEKIDENLERADIVLLLVSSDFMNSRYCYGLEMKRALERHAIKQTIVIPIIVRDVSWHSSPIGHLQALPKDGKAVTSWSNKDSAWRNVAEGIEKIVRQINQP